MRQVFEVPDDVAPGLLKEQPAWQPPCTKTKDGRDIVAWYRYMDGVGKQIIPVSEDGKCSLAAESAYRNGCIPSCTLSIDASHAYSKRGALLWQREQADAPTEAPVEPEKKHVRIELPYEKPCALWCGGVEFAAQATLLVAEGDRRRAAVMQAFKLHPMAYGAASNDWPRCCGEDCVVEHSAGAVVVRCRHGK